MDKIFPNWHITEWLIGSLIILNILDFGTTYVALENMGGYEFNPVLSYLIAITGTIWVIFAFKSIVFAYLILSYAFIEKFRKGCKHPTIVKAFAILTVMYTTLVVNNLYLVIVKPTDYWLS